jgi:hypothetical protein
MVTGEMMVKVKNYTGVEVEVPETPLGVRDTGGCNMLRGGCKCNHTVDPASGRSIWTWDIDPNCLYHKAAAQQPWNHTIPWNCGEGYYDGCNHVGGPYFYDREVGAVSNYWEDRAGEEE